MEITHIQNTLSAFSMGKNSLKTAHKKFVCSTDQELV